MRQKQNAMISSPLIFFLLPQSNEIPPQKMVNSMRPILLQGLLFTKQKTSALEVSFRGGRLYKIDWEKI